MTKPLQKGSGEKPLTPRPPFPDPKPARGPRPVPDHQALLRADQTAVMLGRSTSAFYALLKSDPTFPQAVRLMPSSPPQWIRSEVLEWIRQRPRVAAMAETA